MRLRDLNRSSMCESRDLRTFPYFEKTAIYFSIYECSNISLLQIDAFIYIYTHEKFLQHLSNIIIQIDNIVISKQK